MHVKQTAAIKSICIIRLSALGDVTHMLPIIHSLHKFRPDIKITWIIGKKEYQLVGDLARVEFIQFDKRAGIKAYIKLMQALKNRCFDVLLACQVSLRANLLSAIIKAPRKVGYDAARCKDLHSLCINERISAANGHVLDGFFQFIEHLGIAHKSLDWHLPIPAQAQDFAAHMMPADAPVLAISPCSSHRWRNWHAQGYAEVANYAYEKYHMRTVLLGGSSRLEAQYAGQICQRLKHQAINLTGKDTLKKLLAILKRCSVLISPDSGPAHIATCANTPVIALHAASNSRRSGPYLSQVWCVDKYPQAALQYLNTPVEQLKWGTRIEKPGVMNLIEAKDVIIKLDQIMQTLI